MSEQTLLQDIVGDEEQAREMLDDLEGVEDNWEHAGIPGIVWRGQLNLKINELHLPIIREQLQDMLDD